MKSATVFHAPREVGRFAVGMVPFLNPPGGF